jgi:nitroreductase
VDPLFPERWSRRAMTGGHLDRSSLLTLIEAARWAPSSFNNQPWRFLFALRGTEYFPGYLDLLTPSNRSWADKAGALVIMASRTVFDSGKRSVTHSFDAGAAWMAFALQASMLGLTARGMQGFDYERARILTGLPEDFSVEAMCAVGYPARPDTLPEPLREKEVPTGRKRVEEIAFEGRFPT